MNTTGRDNRKLATKLLGVAVAMFAFGVFAMPGLYDKFCEITGIGQAGIEVAEAAPAGAAGQRTVNIRFDATTNSALNWEFRPLDERMEVTLGQPTEARYFAENLENSAVTGLAVFNVSPPEAARYFVKTQCFCFSKQVLQAGESREMPVYFYVREELPEHIEEFTLAYTFFKNEDPETAQAAR